MTLSAPAALVAPVPLMASVAPAVVGTQREGDLRVMTFNIQSGHEGVDKVAEAIRSEAPDIVALQEVDVHTRRADG
ncbi:MAG: endonuclease/exonuclease/phosphatase family protein, partial [Archangium sp.]